MCWSFRARRGAERAFVAETRGDNSRIGRSEGFLAGRRKKRQEKDALGNFLAPTKEAITTEIYANEADFDSKEYVGTFKGQVIVQDPRFNLQADKLTIYLARGKSAGWKKRSRKATSRSCATRRAKTAGRRFVPWADAERAVYTASDGNVEMTGTPRVQSGLNTHVATSPETVMIINQSGQLTTRGPSRTEFARMRNRRPTPKP